MIDLFIERWNYTLAVFSYSEEFCYYLLTENSKSTCYYFLKNLHAVYKINSLFVSMSICHASKKTSLQHPLYQSSEIDCKKRFITACVCRFQVVFSKYLFSHALHQKSPLQYHLNTPHLTVSFLYSEGLKLAHIFYLL